MQGYPIIPAHHLGIFLRPAHRVFYGGVVMVMGLVFLVLVGLSILGAGLTGNGAALGAAMQTGAQAGITLAISLGGSLCLWSGIGRVLEKAGFTAFLARVLKPLLVRIFPESRRDAKLSQLLSANICANILGLGNAATPMGISAAKRLSGGKTEAGASLCRLIVLNTASIQLIPGTVAGLRASLGAGRPFDILPAVWVTSFCSAALGLVATWALGKVWKA